MRFLLKICVIIFVAIVLFFGHRNVGAETAENKMEHILAVMNKNNAITQQWKWLAKEEITSIHDERAFHQLLQRLQRKTALRNWEIELENGVHKATATKKFTNYEERLVVTWTEDHTIHKESKMLFPPS